MGTYPSTLTRFAPYAYAVERIEAKLFFALCAVLGMRPSEAAAAKWENIRDGVLKVREAAPYGVLGPEEALLQAMQQGKK